MGSGMGLWMMGGGLMMIPLWIGIIALVVWAVQAPTRGSLGGTQETRTGNSPRKPIDIAKERYACGEVTRDEFEQLRRNLEAAEKPG